MEDPFKKIKKTKKEINELETMLENMINKFHKPVNPATILWMISQSPKKKAWVEVYVASNKVSAHKLLECIEDLKKLVPDEEFIRQVLIATIKRKDCSQEEAQKYGNELFFNNASSITQKEYPPTEDNTHTLLESKSE